MKITFRTISTVSFIIILAASSYLVFNEKITIAQHFITIFTAHMLNMICFLLVNLQKEE